MVLGGIPKEKGRTMKKLSTFLIATIAIGALGYLEVAKISPTAKAEEGGAAPGAAGAAEADLPPAKPGECYARMWTPPQLETQAERVQVREASQRITTTPARYEWRVEDVLVEEEGERLIPVPAKWEAVTEQVLVKEASEEIKVIPAKYELRTEKVVVKEGGEKIISVPARYEWKQEKVLAKAGYTTWKKGKGAYQKVNNSTGEIMCLVEVPPTYKAVRTKVLAQPATTKTVSIKPTYQTIRKRVLVEEARVVKKEIPAQYKTVKKLALAEPATTRSVKTPAKYKQIRQHVQVEPAGSQTVEIPAEFTNVTKQVKVADGRMEWKAILCETNATRGTIQQIQQALRSNDYKVAKSGKLDRSTLGALSEFQRQKGLPEGQLTIETLNALGLEL